jgi:subtilisin family serine protease
MLTGLLLAVLAMGPSPKLSDDLRGALQTHSTARETAWVFFADKGVQSASAGRATLTPRALSRRALRGEVTLSPEDVPLVPTYVDAVRAGVLRLRNTSRWFNAVSVEATPDQLAALAELPFVSRLERVRRWRGQPEPVASASTVRAQSTSAHLLDYGTSLGQLEQIRVPELHDLGADGAGVVVALLDSGFDTLGHESLAQLRIVATHDFVNGDDDVADGDVGEGSHGTATLSTIGGFQPGQLIGPAYGAFYLLAKTENTESETPVEEDNWAAAAEWAESQGADVISSSLGYVDFDPPFTGYTPAQLDGRTAISTRAAELAAERGVVVVVSVGNSGLGAAGQGTIGAPADGAQVIAAGAVDALGVRASFSSVGPTADGRIKPDVAAQGVGVKVALADTVNGYRFANGTSFACPLVAGAAALVIQHHQDYTPAQVAEALRRTASQAARPDTLLGHGIVDTLAAVQAVVAP